MNAACYQYGQHCSQLPHTGLDLSLLVILGLLLIALGAVLYSAARRR